MENEKRVLWSEFGFFLKVQIHQKYIGKTKQKPLENETLREETGKTRANAGHHGRGDHHGLAVAATTGRGGHHCPTVVASGPCGRLFL